MLAQQIDFDGNDETFQATGREFEKVIKQYLIKIAGCYYWEREEEEGLKGYLDSITTSGTIMGLFKDRRWQDFFLAVDLYAPYLSSAMYKPERIVIRNVPYRKVDGTFGKTELFVILRDLKRLFRVECKFQKVSGTAEDKIYRTITDLTHCGSKESIIVTGGEGFRPQTIPGLKRMVAKQNIIIDRHLLSESKIYIANEKEFQEFVTDFDERRFSIR